MDEHVLLAVNHDRITDQLRRVHALHYTATAAAVVPVPVVHPFVLYRDRLLSELREDAASDGPDSSPLRNVVPRPDRRRRIYEVDVIDLRSLDEGVPEMKELRVLAVALTARDSVLPGDPHAAFAHFTIVSVVVHVRVDDDHLSPRAPKQ